MMKKFLVLLSFICVQLVAAQVTDEKILAAEVVENENTIYNVTGIESKPEFPGGIEKFHQFIASNFRQPTDKEFKGGRMHARFVIEKDGSVTEIEVRHIGYGTKEEAIRVLSLSPKWIPGKQRGEIVRCMYFIPINLKGN